MRLKQVSLYVTRKLVKLVILLFAVCLFSFILISYSPIDPVQSYIGADMTRVSPEQYEQIADYWGLHQSKSEQFVKWMSSVLRGDLGSSLLYRNSVGKVISERFLASIILMGSAWIISGVFGYFIGIIAGIFKQSWIDQMIKGFCFILQSTPTFWLGLVLILFFSVRLGWLPSGLGAPIGILTEEVSMTEHFRHMILPVLTLSIVGVSNVALHTRQKLIDVYESEYIWFAKAKGEKGVALFFKHGLRNVSIPAISIHFASFGELFGGTILAEQILSYPGLGQAVVRAGLGGDVPLLLGIVLFSTIFVFIGNSLADLLYKLIDPQLRRREAI